MTPGNPDTRDTGLNPLSEFRAGLARLAFGTSAAQRRHQGSTEVTDEIAEANAFVPPEMLELDLDDPGQRTFGDFELLERLGEGGMGVVYRARQHSLDREVAVKLLSAGPWASEAFIAGFKHEAQSAARLQHPNIVAVYAIGEQEGLIYYAMELIRGETMDHFLDRRQMLPPREAATLIRTAAEAVDYAHRLGVLHLDLKPGNVLLDRMGTPKIADFGLARRLDAALSLRNETVAGTPSYMAPEQAVPNHGVLTPATDVWGLGAMLYECLTGTPPFLADTPEETLRLLCEARVRKPSRNVVVPRDMEAICLKCLSRMPRQRYISARELADDLGRYLEGRMVNARPLHSWQRVGHWALREPRLAFALGGIVMALLTGITATSLEWARAERSAASMREVNRFLNEDILTAADPYRIGLDQHGVVALLVRAESHLDSSFIEEDEARAQIGLSIGRAYFGHGLWSRARSRLERTYASASKSLGPDHPITLDIAEYLAQTCIYDARYARAEAIYRELIPARTRTDGATARKTLRTRGGHALLLYETDQFENATREYEALRKDALAHAPEQVPEIEWTLSELYTETNRWDEAMALIRKVLKRSAEQLGKEHPQYLWETMSLGDMYMMRGQWDEAEAVFNVMHDGLASTIGYGHPKTLTAIHYLGLIRLERGHPAEAMPLLQYAMDGRMRVHGEDHKYTHYSMNRVGQALIALGRTDEAIALLEKTLASVDRTGRRRQAYVILILDNLGQAYLQRGEPARAETYLAEALATARETLPENNVRRGMIERTMGQLRAQQGRIDDARQHYARAERIFVEGWGEEHPWVQGIRRQVAALPRRGSIAAARPQSEAPRDEQHTHY
ncbi:MAG TPA: tetratricopeptide repeat protein [Lysobacter sp.]|nr:tetratricopeptide repeat protein [Lysobacter sp.]